jgi:hypothetical protein
MFSSVLCRLTIDYTTIGPQITFNPAPQPLQNQGAKSVCVRHEIGCFISQSKIQGAVGVGFSDVLASHRIAVSKPGDTNSKRPSVTV